MIKKELLLKLEAAKSLDEFNKLIAGYRINASSIINKMNTINDLYISIVDAITCMKDVRPYEDNFFTCDEQGLFHSAKTWQELAKTYILDKAEKLDCPELPAPISEKELKSIIETKLPLGVFWRKEKNVFIGCDNNSGDAFTEEFKTEADLFYFLYGWDFS